MRTTTCPKCGVRQDADSPVCCHLAGRKGGRRTAERHGPEHFRRIALIRAALRNAPANGDGK